MGVIDLQELNELFSLFNSITPVSDELLEVISRYVKKKQYQKGESILKAGEVETKSNYVLNGVVLQYVFDDDIPITINITPKGLTFNSLKSYLESSPSIEIHEAITDVELLYLEKDDIEMLAQQYHEFSYLMFKLHENILMDRENRMFLLQYRNPFKRYQLFRENVERARMIIPQTHDKYIASYLNMTPQQYSKEKRNYELNMEANKTKNIL